MWPRSTRDTVGWETSTLGDVLLPQPAPQANGANRCPEPHGVHRAIVAASPFPRRIAGSRPPVRRPDMRAGTGRTAERAYEPVCRPTPRTTAGRSTEPRRPNSPAAHGWPAMAVGCRVPVLPGIRGHGRRPSSAARGRAHVGGHLTEIERRCGPRRLSMTRSQTVEKVTPAGGQRDLVRGQPTVERGHGTEQHIAMRSRHQPLHVVLSALTAPLHPRIVSWSLDRPRRPTRTAAGPIPGSRHD